MAEQNLHWVQLQDDILPFRGGLGQAADTVVNENVSNYPIFFAYPGENNDHAPGIFVLEISTNRGIVWRVNVSTLEELVAKNIVTQDKIDPFRKVYKNSPDTLCFLIADEGGARFGFVPRATAS
jgi:hypothetical protein